MYFPKGYKVGHTWMETQMNFYHQILTSPSNFFESETHFVRHSWTHLRFGVNTHKSSNTHTSCLINALHQKTLLYFHITVFIPSFHIRAWHLFQHLSVTWICSPFSKDHPTRPLVWNCLDKFHSEASLRLISWTGHISHLIATLHHQGNPVL